MSADLLLEIGTEEIPAAFMPGALASLKELAEKEFREHRIGYGDAVTFGTPRRLVLIMHNVASMQDDLVITKLGPAKSAGFTPDGTPTKAALGFAKSQGVAVEELTVVPTEKGEYLCAKRRDAGAPTQQLLPELLPSIIAQLPFPKSMRWKDLDVRFARPIHWILALYGDTVVPFTFGGIISGSMTRGHRFMAPDPVPISDVASYLQTLRAASVIVDPAERKTMIIEKLRELAATVGGRPDEDQALLDEVCFLVEAPFPVLCHFEEAFLSLPVEVLVTTMKKHQKYFPVVDAYGAPKPYFIAVNNTDCRIPDIVKSGHERVLRARLADAQFFYSEDLKKSLADLTESLRGVVFQAKLGTSYEKVMRFQALAVHVAERLGKPALIPKVKRAAYLCKADLMSEMVGEFPELQGIMGREYARRAGEPQDVAEAIFEHYLPRFAGDSLPKTDIGAIISISDKLDTIVGCFGIGLIPTGTADPYALRRQCLGIINIILEKTYLFSLTDLIDCALEGLAEKLTRPNEQVRSDVLAFFSGRLETVLSGQGIAADVIDAVLARGIDFIPDCFDRAAALQQMKLDPAFESLAISFKRVVNILRSAEPQGSVAPTLFNHDAEKMLHQRVETLRDRVQQLMDTHRYLEALRLIATLRDAVDAFFDNVLVMDEDMRLRNNRLCLLRDISNLFDKFADFSKIASS
ncbi:MAG: glycine--tRNA ligase subunit beta [Desulfobacterota bacterium]|nr:glycine--tRNA ligase subunit beta [Thermodesulfobacteriota bacterium]